LHDLWSGHDPYAQRCASQQQPHQDVDCQQRTAAHAPAVQFDIFGLLAADKQVGDQRDEVQYQPADGGDDDKQLLR